MTLLQLFESCEDEQFNTFKKYKCHLPFKFNTHRVPTNEAP